MYEKQVMPSSKQVIDVNFKVRIYALDLFFWIIILYNRLSANLHNYVENSQIPIKYLA